MWLLVDANLSPRVAHRLRQAGHDAIHVEDVDLIQADDDVILGFAAEQDRVIVSADADFGALLAQHRLDRPSFILLRSPDAFTPDQQADLLVANLGAVTEPLDRGAIVSLARFRLRVRVLPIDRED